MFRDKGETFKVELIDAIPADQPIKIYKQGDWFDLCRGPHMTSTGKVGNAFKLMKVAGAYWRGDSNNPMLTRIYGTAFAKQEELDAYLKQLEEAEKRDHRRLGREMDLFHFQEEAPGSVFWHAKGWTLFQALENYIRRRQSEEFGFAEVNAPQLMDSSLWVASGHMATFRESMFLTQAREDDERVFVVKPMNCPGHIQIFKNGLKSYRDLPFKLAEFGKVHRFEPSGALHGSDARARLHAGRRARLHHRQPDRRRSRSSSTTRFSRSTAILASTTSPSSSPIGRKNASATTPCGTRRKRR